MYCVIQEIPTKKPNKGGYAKELKAEYMKITIMGRDDGYYYYTTKGKFDRPIKKAYKNQYPSILQRKWTRQEETVLHLYSELL